MDKIVSPIATQLARSTLGAPQVPRDGAVTPAEKRLSRPLLEAINIPHRKVQKICCIGAGYVGKLQDPFLIPRRICVNGRVSHYTKISPYYKAPNVLMLPQVALLAPLLL